ncbi:MAG TPA: APH(3') family aminoglycoside O-phosphotransferase [Ktedonobacterales bacterium]
MLTPESLTLPREIARPLSGATLNQITIGRSGSQVYLARAEGQPARYLKIASQPFRDELADERYRLDWLRGRLPVPEVLAFARDNEYSYLLLSEVPGTVACDAAFSTNIAALVQLLASGLRQVHQLDMAGCPFDMRLDQRIAQAERRMRGGAVDEEDFDESRLGKSVETLFEQLLSERPAEEDLVFTHGDFCLPNVLIDRAHNRVSGFVDWSRAGVADRYQDLALAARSLAYNFGPGYEPLLWEAYGIDRHDAAKVAYYQLLDEFF